MNSRVPIVAARTLDEAIASNLITFRAAASVSGGLGLVGLLLAAIGIYGVTAYAVTRRTREIGIRVAMGASASDIVRMVLRQGMVLTGAGAVIGLVLAALAGVFASRIFVGVPPLDATTVGASALLLAAVGLAACYVPARRAARLDPAITLRYE
jgi:putative ABC transport system permease protein